MTSEQNDAIDRALSADALHQAAKQGEPAAAALLIYGKAMRAGVGGLAALVKRNILTSFGNCTDPVALRDLAAKAMSHSALDAPIRQIRRTARNYLKDLSARAPAPTPKILLDLAYEHARRMLMDKSERELPPTWLLTKCDGLVTVVVTPFDNDAMKDAVVAGMRQMMSDEDVVAYAHVAEAWMGGPESRVRPRDDPDRIEIVTANAYTATEGESACWAIKRDADGKPVDLELLERGKGASGRFSWLLSKHDDQEAVSLKRAIGEFIFIKPEQMSLEFRQRVADIRKEDFACNGPIITIKQLGMIVMRSEPDGGQTADFACLACAELPREVLIEAFGRKNHDVKLSPELVKRCEDWALANVKAATETRQ